MNVREADNGELFVGFHQRAYRVRPKRHAGALAVEVDVGASYRIDDGVGELFGQGPTRTLTWFPLVGRLVPLTENDRIPRDLHQALVAHFSGDDEDRLTAAS